MAGIPTAHMLACLRIGNPVSAIAARPATDLLGSRVDLNELLGGSCNRLLYFKWEAKQRAALGAWRTTR